MKGHTEGALDERVEMNEIGKEMNGAAEGVEDDGLTHNQNGGYDEEARKLLYNPFEDDVMNEINEMDGTKPEQKDDGKNIDMDEDDMDPIKSLNGTAIGHDKDEGDNDNEEVVEGDIITINETHAKNDVDGDIIEAIDETSMGTNSDAYSYFD